MLVSIVATGNHFIIDAVAGGLVVLAAYVFAVNSKAGQSGKPSSRSRRPSLCTNATVDVTNLKTRYTDGARRRFFKVGVLLAGLGVTADMLTITGLLLHAVAVPFIVTGHFVTAAVISVIAGVCDALDGAVARAGIGASKAGAFLDSTTDRMSEMLIWGALVIYMARHERWYDCRCPRRHGGRPLVSYTRARAEALGVECKVGLMSRPERIVVLNVGFLFSAWSIGGVSILTIAIYALAVLTSVTVAQRMRHVMGTLRP